MFISHLGDRAKEDTMRPWVSSTLIFGGFMLLLAGCGGGGGTDPEPQACSLTVLAPQVGASFPSGVPANIRWEKTGQADAVSIELWQAGAKVGTVVASTENDLFYPWSADVLGGVGGDFTIRITAVGEAGCTAESGVFAIANTAACEINETMAFDPDPTLTAGDDFPITWQSHDTLARVGIELRYGHNIDEVLVGTIARDTPDDGEFIWAVDSFNDAGHRSVTDNTHYWLRIFAEDISGCEGHSSDFELVDDEICSSTVWLAPSQSLYAAGDTIQIGYSVSPWSVGETVKMRLYGGNTPVPGGYITLPEEDLPAEGGATLKWVVDDYGFPGSSVFRVRVIKLTDEYCWGESDAFTIQN